MPPAKRLCGNYSLVMINLPEDVVTRPTEIEDFFVPITVKSLEYVFSGAAGLTRIWRVNFFSPSDMNRALLERQWKVRRNQSKDQ